MFSEDEEGPRAEKATWKGFSEEGVMSRGRLTGAVLRALWVSVCPFLKLHCSPIPTPLHALRKWRALWAQTSASVGRPGSIWSSVAHMASSALSSPEKTCLAPSSWVSGHSRLAQRGGDR